MNIKNLLSCALILGTLSAQSLVYDNGPLETAPAQSVLQNLAPMSMNVFGFGVQANATTNNSCADDFAVNSTLAITDVEVFLYQTGSTTTSTITAVYVEIYADNGAGAPGVAVPGSPGIATALTPVTNVWTGLYRHLPAPATNRPIMAVRVLLPTPVVLTNGIYWLQFKAAGSLTSGPWAPPVTVLDQADTGNGMQQIGLTGAWNLVNSRVAPAIARSAFPFRLYGGGGLAGSIVMTGAGGCSGATGIKVEGAPNAGGFLKTTLQGVVGLGLIGYDFNLADTPFCGCNFDHGWSIVVAATSNTIIIPMSPSFAGLAFGIQGVDFGAPGGCPIGFTVTDGYTATLALN